MPGGSRQTEADAVQACEAELAEEIRIGSLDGAAEYSFSDINSIAVSESGTVYVDDAHPSTIREFGADGRFARSIGREGGDYALDARPSGWYGEWMEWGDETVYAVLGGVVASVLTWLVRNE